MPPLPAWLNPLELAAPTFFLWVVAAYFLTIIGGEWISDALCTLGLALKIEPLFVGLTVTTAVGIVPMVALASLYSVTAQPDLALGTLVGAAWGTSLLPLILAGLSIPVGLGQRWPRVDLPLFVMYVGLWVLVCAEPGAHPWRGWALLMAAAAYLALRYFHGKEARYGLETFGRNFVFGASVVGTLFRLAVGLTLMAVGGFFLIKLTLAAGERWHLPAFPLGILAALPLCVAEVAFALSAIKKGQGELILGRGLGLGALVVLVGAWVLNRTRALEGAETLSLTIVGLGVALLGLWAFARAGHRLWRWQAVALLLFALLAFALAWVQGYGLLPHWVMLRQL